MYAEYFGMRDDPFRMTPDPGFIYTGPVFKTAFDRLHAQLLRNQPVLLLTGAPGTGKTTVLKKLEAELLSAGFFVLFPRYSKLPLDDLLRACCELAEVRADEAARLGAEEGLRHALAARRARGEKTALLVDEAQAMADEVLDGLSRLAADEEGSRVPMQVVFSGHIELAERLAKSAIPAARDAAVDPCRLEPLTPSEVGEYISHRLRVAGCPDAGLFEPQSVRLISELSSGIPRHINRISGMSLQLAHLEARKSITADLVQDPAAIGGPGPALEALLESRESLKAEEEPSGMAGSASPPDRRSESIEGAWPAGLAIPKFFSAQAEAASDQRSEEEEQRTEIHGAEQPPAGSEVADAGEEGSGTARPPPAAARRPEPRQGPPPAAEAPQRRTGSFPRTAVLGAGFLLGLLIGGAGMLTYLERPEEQVEGQTTPRFVSPVAEDAAPPAQQAGIAGDAYQEAPPEPEASTDSVTTPARETALAVRSEDPVDQATAPPDAATAVVETARPKAAESEPATEQGTTKGAELASVGQAPPDEVAAEPEPATEVADARPVAPPELVVQDARGDEDDEMPLRISARSPEGSGADDVAILVSGLPEGSALSGGVEEGGAWRLRIEDLATLALRLPLHYSGHFEASVEASTRPADGEPATTVQALAVAVTPVADPPIVSADPAAGREDEAVPLSIDARLVDADGSETLTIRLGGLPADARLSAGSEDGEGFWSLRTEDLEGLALQPPADFAGRFDLTVEAVAQEAGGQRAATTAVLPVEVAPVADPPVLAIENAGGLEDEAIPLSIGATLADLDGSETLSVAITGLPAGARLSAGAATADGLWRLAPEDLAGLSLRPPDGYSGRLELAIEAASREAGGEQAVAAGVLVVEVAAVADAPVLVVEDARGLEDEAIPLSIGATLADPDGSETLAVAISGLPAGVRLSAGEATADGLWRLAPDDLAGLALQPPDGYSGRLELAVEAVARESNGEQAVTAATLAVEVAAVADAPILAAEDARGLEDKAIPLSISAALADKDGSETLSVAISNLPAGARLSAGEATADGLWRLAPEDLAGLSLRPAEGYGGRLELAVEALARESNGEQAVVAGVLAVEVAAVADAPVLVVEDARGLEDEAIPLAIGATLADPDGSETLSVAISNLPAGARLSAGRLGADGAWHLGAEDLAGLLFLAPADLGGRFDLAVQATAEEAGGESQAATATLAVVASPVADAPHLTVAAATGREDAAIPLSIGATLVDKDGSETLSLVISGVPEGASLTAGVVIGDGGWRLEPGDLAGLAMTPPADYSGVLELAVEAIAQEAQGARAVSAQALTVEVAPVADPPTLSVADAAGPEDSAIPIPVKAELADRDGSEALSVVVSGLPAGALLSAGEPSSEGGWRLAPDDLAGLAVTPPAGYSGRLELAIDAVAREADGTQAASAGAVSVEVAPVADDPVLTVEPAVGREDDPVPLSIVAASGDPDGSEVLSVSLSGIPAGARLTAGDEAGDGTWRLTPEDLPGLALVPPVDFSGGFELAAEVVAEEPGGGRATTGSTFPVEIAPVADPPLLTLDSAAGMAGQPIPLSIAAARVDLDGSERLSLSISGLPEGVRLSAGEATGEGLWSLSPNELTNLALEAPVGFSGSFDLGVEVAAEEADGGRAVTAGQLTVEIVPAKEPAAVIADAAAAAASKVTDTLVEPAAAKAADRPALTTAQAQQAAPPGAQWMARGDQLLNLGDIAAARLYYELAADEGHPRAATAVGKTFDPRFLKDRGVLGTSGNPGKAMAWYQRAIEGGDAEAADRLSALRQWLGQ